MEVDMGEFSVNNSKKKSGFPVTLHPRASTLRGPFSQ